MLLSGLYRHGAALRLQCLGHGESLATDRRDSQGQAALHLRGVDLSELFRSMCMLWLGCGAYLA